MAKPPCPCAARSEQVSCEQIPRTHPLVEGLLQVDKWLISDLECTQKRRQHMCGVPMVLMDLSVTGNTGPRHKCKLVLGCAVTKTGLRRIELLA